MKATRSVKVDFFLAALILAALFFFSAHAFAVEGDQTGAGPHSLIEINKKLDESQKREEKILANQEKIIAEILKSRKWAFNN